ncbi:Crp/Fnr family transcriptional regulator [Chryseobacterium sp. 09-1422]|uniref:Crp/Fnr family transcriptional regulator n=1 Tax=Chryseobacterium kimseyorum TaxID=2984028 RepID=A0ABT3I2M6_9FLAO|nr:Crp/Fnr family transcriptional regulator [Chryseobacterium kimseyorum]MCW3170262.1 Crp/Fnr family transcriptional regulator [Chryseobacterium kimseyorum]
MIINEHVLLSHGADIFEYKRGECIFFEGSVPKYYYQIIKGVVKLTSLNKDGREFVHGFPFEGHCFGESYLFTDKNYAISAFAESKCHVIRIAKDAVFKIYSEYPDTLWNVVKYSADRLHFRYIISSFLSIGDPSSKIEILFKYLKTYFHGEADSLFVIPYTRKQIANLTGLRLETVVRVIKRMEASEQLQIINKKIYF